MAALSEHGSSRFVKMLYIGDSGTGKTGSLTSLVAAGYKLRILDLDNGLSSLRQFVGRECPDKIGNVDYQTRRDSYKMTQSGPTISGTPKAFVESVKLMSEWDDGSSMKDWGEDTVFVLDSLTTMGNAALAWAESMNPTVRDRRQWYFTAQAALEKMLMMLTDDAVQTNVIIISHISLVEIVEGVHKGYPSAVGKAFGPHIPKYFNTLVLAETTGQGKSVKRRIKTVPTGIIDLKTPVPFKIDAELPLETGLADLFTLTKEI